MRFGVTCGPGLSELGCGAGPSDQGDRFGAALGNPSDIANAPSSCGLAMRHPAFRARTPGLRQSGGPQKITDDRLLFRFLAKRQQERGKIGFGNPARRRLG